MDIGQFIDNLLSEIGADNRIKDGIFKMRDKSHLDVLRETLSSKLKDESLVREILNGLIDESEASELAHKKGWEFKGGYWWDASGPIARTVDGKLKTLDQIEDERRAEERHKELDRDKAEAELEQDKKEERNKRRSEKETERIIKGIDYEEKPQIQEPVKAPVQQIQLKPQEPEEDKSTRIARIRSKAYAQLNREGKEVVFSTILNEDNIVGFILENGKLVLPRSTEDPRYTLNDTFLEQEGWSEFRSL